MMASHEIDIRAFRQILFLPLTLSLGEKDDKRTIACAVKGIADALASEDSRWEEIKDHLNHLGSVTDAYAYSEFVYFHPYIQQFLYDGPDAEAGDSKSKHRALRLFKRKQRGALDLKFLCNDKLVSIQLPIDRLHLYLFDLGVAILVVELAPPNCPRVNSGSASEENFTLAHVLALQNAVRRLYPAYFKRAGDAWTTGEYPVSLRWSLAMDERPLWTSDWIDAVAERRVNPIDPTWMRILDPLPIETDSKDKSRRWRQIVDERMPSMVFLAVEKPQEISRGDLIRLCLMDDPGPSDALPYSSSFLQDFERESCLDIFWHYGARYMFSGYSMTALGGGDPKNPDDFFCHTIGKHFRRHYFQMGLLIQFQFAALLAFSHRVSEATRLKQEHGADWFREEMQRIEERFLTFEQRYWFTQISNQMQAREMYDLWIERTGVRKIYEEVRDQVRAANDFLDAQAQNRQAAAAERLSIVATYGVVAGLAIGALGMNVLGSLDFLESFGVPKAAPAPLHFGAAHLALLVSHIGVFSLALGLAAAFARWALGGHAEGADAGEDGGVARRLHEKLGHWAIGAFFVFLLCLLVAAMAGK